MTGGSEFLWIMAVAAAGLFDSITTHMALSTGRFDELNWWPRWLYRRCSPAVFVVLHPVVLVVVTVAAMMLVPTSGTVPPMVMSIVVTWAAASNAYQLWQVKKEAKRRDR